MQVVKVTPSQFLIARKQLKLKQKEVAAAISIMPTTFSFIENDKTEPKLSTYHNLIDFYEERGIIFHADGNVTMDKSSGTD